MCGSREKAATRPAVRGKCSLTLVFLALGTTATERQHAYRELFRHHVDDAQLHAIREALNHELVLGRSHFKDKIEALTERQTRLGIPGRPCVKEEDGVYYID